jgi:hypothetical protein
MRALPRACTMRSGMRSWSKWVIFSRRMKSSSSVAREALPQGVLVVGHRDALVGGHRRMAAPGLLVQFIAVAAALAGGCALAGRLAGGH